MKHDSQGRQFIAQHDVRSALVSANASLTTGTATSLISGDADYFLDIVEITFSNNTTVAGGVSNVDLISDGTIVRTVSCPPGVTQLFFDAPLKQITKGTPWNVDLVDITGDTIAVGATLIRKLN
jgi:hypothetical protein